MTNKLDIPDFSGDDFANDKGILETRAAIKAQEKILEDSLLIVQNTLGLEKTKHRDFSHFHLFKKLDAGLESSFGSPAQHHALQASVVSYFSSVSAGKARYEGWDNYLFGHFFTRKEYPATYISKESIHEKINDLFVRQDVDFSHSKKFSRRFHVITEDKGRLSDLLLLKELDTLCSFREMEIELNGKECLFRHSRSTISVKEAEKFSELAKALLLVFH
ncbi:MAG: hypothetical protein QM687_09135 [Ferruginibacter sp.]